MGCIPYLYHTFPYICLFWITDNGVGAIIISELEEVIKKYGKPRKTEIIYASDIAEEEEEEQIPDYPVTLWRGSVSFFFSRQQT